MRDDRNMNVFICARFEKFYFAAAAFFGWCANDNDLAREIVSVQDLGCGDARCYGRYCYEIVATCMAKGWEGVWLGW